MTVSREGQGSRNREDQRGKQKIVEAKDKLISIQIMILLHVSCLPRGWNLKTLAWGIQEKEGDRSH